MAKVIFIKRHPSGIPEGKVHEFNDKHAERLISEGFCETHVEGSKTGKAAPVVNTTDKVIDYKVTAKDLKDNREAFPVGTKAGTIVQIENPDYIEQ